MTATCSSAFVQAALRKALANTALPWGSWSIVLLSDSSVRDGATLDELHQVLDAKAATDWTVQEYEDAVEYDPGPPVVEAEPEVLPSVYLTAPPTWTNSGETAVTVRALAIVAEHSVSGDDDVLMWTILDTPVTIEPEADYTPDEFSFSIVELADTPATSAWLVFETANHRLAGKPMGAATTPTVARWKDFQDNTLGTRFKAACEKLERLCYALWGSAPKSYTGDIPWYHRLNPRCFWKAEQWRQVWTGELDGLGDPKCTAYNWEPYETAAAGTNESQTPPSVPARSQSGDWKLQMLDSERPNNATVFPYGSLERDDGTQVDYKGRKLYDPIGTGDFGGDPIAPAGTDGDHEVADAEDVVIAWTPPAAIASLVNSVTLYTNINSGGWSSAAMSLDGGAYKATITGQVHNSTCLWYVKVVYTPEGGSPITVYAPGDTTEPVEPYSFKWFYHWSPFPHGLPELWSVCAKGTDRYLFDEYEEVQPELINLCRFVLDYIGVIYSHSPRLRPDNLDCCRPAPITWRWSGSNGKKLYLAGGKSSIDQVSPLHDLDGLKSGGEMIQTSVVSDHTGNAIGVFPGLSGIVAGCRFTVVVDSVPYGATVSEVLGQGDFLYEDATPGMPNLVGETLTFYCSTWAGSELARRSWRGSGDLKPDDSNSPYYGGGASWETYPAQILTEKVDDIASDVCDNYYVGETAGIQAGDVIDVSHVEEIIAAVDYLCVNGLWLQREIAFRVMTPTWEINELSCASGDCSDDGDPWAEPTWADCWDTEVTTPPQGVCPINYGAATCAHWGVNEFGECYGGTGPYSCIPSATRDVDASPAVLACDAAVTGYGCAITSDEFCNVIGDCSDERAKKCTFNQWGWAGYVCGPVQCPNGVDADHGHGDQGMKRRYYDEGYEGSCGDLVARGNCFKSTAYICGYVVDDLGEVTDSHDIEAETVTPVFVWPNCGTWGGNACNLDYDLCLPQGCHDRNDFADLPGYPDNIEPVEEIDGTISYEDLCFSTCFIDDNPDPESLSVVTSGCSINMEDRCSINYCWMEVDLNLVTDEEAEDYGMPQLVDYDLDPDISAVPCDLTDDQKKERLTWCPCLTETGPEECEDYCDQELPA